MGVRGKNLGPVSLHGSGAAPPPTTLSVGGSDRAPEKSYVDAYVKRYILSDPGLHQPRKHTLATVELPTGYSCTEYSAVVHGILHLR